MDSLINSKFDPILIGKITKNVSEEKMYRKKKCIGRKNVSEEKM